LTAQQINDLVAALAPIERDILLNLFERGPGLPLEVAVRLLKMPSEVDGPLGRLSSLGLVQSNSIGGNNVLRLSDSGNQVVGVLQDSRLLGEIDAAARREDAPPAAMALSFGAPPPDPREREIALLLQLADLAKQSGDLEKAMQWTKEALDVQRSQAAGAGQ
jgi:hypothetical protein